MTSPPLQEARGARQHAIEYVTWKVPRSQLTAQALFETADAKASAEWFHPCFFPYRVSNNVNL